MSVKKDLVPDWVILQFFNIVRDELETLDFISAYSTHSYSSTVQINSFVLRIENQRSQPHPNAMPEKIAIKRFTDRNACK